jgi:23S rRNA (cytidine2498-2'-O)-methyltransferase
VLPESTDAPPVEAPPVEAPLADAPPAEPETGYLAPADYVAELVAELGDVSAVHGRLVLAHGAPRPAAWAQNVWYAPRRVAIASIGEAAKALRAIQRNWALYAFQNHRRAALIEARLPPLKPKPLVFPNPPPAAPLGSWTLLAPDLLLAASRCASPFVHGEAVFAEDREAPPNRAYLKLWEALTRLGRRPARGELCLDLGASPGGWTWVLLELGARVVAVDKAPLDPRIAARAQAQGKGRLTIRQESAFALDPRDIGRVDWLFCDVACYPARLLTLMQRWVAAGTCGTIVATIKFQGPTDLAAQRAFAAVPGARLMHLFHNKHELTWIWSARSAKEDSAK